MKKQPESAALIRLDILRLCADDMLVGIREVSGAVESLLAEYNAAMATLTDRYEARLKPLREDLAADEKALISLMKKDKRSLFADGIGTVRLENGSLIYNRTDRVTIPRDALASCKSQGFRDVIKIAESLDRDAIEKWTDEKLLLIGAERKPKEEFNYDLKKEPGK